MALLEGATAGRLVFDRVDDLDIQEGVPDLHLLVDDVLDRLPDLPALDEVDLGAPPGLYIEHQVDPTVITLLLRLRALRWAPASRPKIKVVDKIPGILSGDGIARAVSHV